MFEYDICLCGNNENCLKRDECMRVVHKAGIYTVSLFYDPNIKECEYFIERKKEVEDNA